MGPPVRFGQALCRLEPPLGPALRLNSTAGTFPYVQDLRRFTDFLKKSLLTMFVD